MDIKWNKSMEELKSSNLNKNDKIYFVCSKCHKEQMLRYQSVIKRNYFICRACRGVEKQLEIKKTNPNYGWFRHCKTAEWMISEEFKTKRRQTMFEKHGCEYTTQSPKLRKKMQKTLEDKFGENFYEVIQQHREENNLKNFGVRIKGFQDEESKKKSKETCIDKYGYEYIAQVPEIREKQALTSHKKWKVKINDKIIYFDSKPEIYYYFWLQDNGIKFEYNKKYHKKYFDNTKQKYRSYYYDFHILNDDTYVELKGDCFFNKDNEPIATAPYENYNWTDKYNFLIEEKIPIIITSRIENGDLFYIKENFQKNHKDVEVYK